MFCMLSNGISMRIVLAIICLSLQINTMPNRLHQVKYLTSFQLLLMKFQLLFLTFSSDQFQIVMLFNLKESSLVIKIQVQSVLVIQQTFLKNKNFVQIKIFWNRFKSLYQKIKLQVLVRMQVSQSHSLKQLKSFLQSLSQSSNPDSYWQSILQSDIRNIIPKYEVAKIELVKTSISKVRLILENLNSFISLQIQKKYLKEQMINLNENVSQQLEEIIESNQKNESKHHYDTNLSLRRKQFQLLYKELTKNRSLPELKALVAENKKWTEYIEKHVKVLEKVKEEQLHEQIINFIETYEGLFNISSEGAIQDGIYEPSPRILEQKILKSGSYTKLYEEHLHDKILIQKLVDSIYSVKKQNQIQNNKPSLPSDENDYWAKQVKKLRQVHNL